MYQKDYILRLIEAFSFALAKILGFKNKGEYKLAMDEIHRIYSEMLKLNIKDIKNLPLANMKIIEIEKLEMIAELLKVEGEIADEDGHDNKSINLLNKALQIFKYVDTHTTTFSFDRKNKIAEIENKLTKNET